MAEPRAVGPKYNPKFLKNMPYMYLKMEIEKAMELVAKLQLDPTEKDPLRIVLDKGLHEIKGGPKCNRGRSDVDCSHITFVGKGKAQTTILGGFFVKTNKMLHLQN
jgi:hypothetical protein